MEALKKSEMAADRRRIDCDERVVAIEVKTATGQHRRGYAIYDSYLGYWRGDCALDEYYAWTRDTARRAVFDTRAEAERELTAILDGRRNASPVTLELPYPPSVNHYWRRVGARTLISREGRRFRARVAALLATRRIPCLDGPLDVHVTLHPPDRRRRDLDNPMKALLDALAHGSVYQDDGQIDRLDIVRREVVPDGKVIVRIAPMSREAVA